MILVPQYYQRRSVFNFRAIEKILQSQMKAEFKEIQEVFAENNLRLPTLNVLDPDAHFHETLAVQPGGDIAAPPNFIGHLDHPLAVRLLSDFLRLAVEKNSDLFLSPEYSFLPMGGACEGDHAAIAAASR